MKKYVKEFFEKAVAKRREHDKKKAERKAKGGGPTESPAAVPDSGVKKEEESDGDQGMDLSDDEEDRDEQHSGTPITPTDQVANGDGLKRKREGEEGPNGIKFEDEDATPSKRPRSATPPPPPPPPPPTEGLPVNQPTVDDMAGYNDESPNGDGISIRELPVKDESMDDVDQPPVPPPPVTARPDHLDQDGMEIFDGVPTQEMVTTPPTPGAADGSPDGARDGGYEGMNTERLHQLEVHYGV